jgi:DDE superfamily endonuclease
MTNHHRSPNPSPSSVTAVSGLDPGIVPPILVTLMAAFRGFFTAPVWDHVLVLVSGAVLTSGKRTVSAALRIMGLTQAGDFALYHHVLSQARWDSRAIARKLLMMILERFLPTGPLIIGIDDTIERRWGHKIAARGIYRDPVRSSHGHFVKASGLRWLSFMAMIPLPLARRRWALPFLTVLAPSQRYDDTRGKRHKSLVDWGRQGILQIRRWLPNRLIIIVADSSFAAIELIAAVRRHVCFVTRLRLDANLFAPPERRPGRGRPPKKGRKLPKLADILADPATVWTTLIMSEWYGGKRCRLEFTSATAIWYHNGLPPLPIRWVLVRDPEGIRKPQAFLCTDLAAAPQTILGWYVHRWSVETTFQETREHLGVETQRQWSDRAIARTTPALLGLFSLIALWAAEAKIAAALHPRSAAWYVKDEMTFSDALAAVRRVLWDVPNLAISRLNPENVEIPAALLQRLLEAVCYTT